MDVAEEKLTAVSGGEAELEVEEEVEDVVEEIEEVEGGEAGGGRGGEQEESPGKTIDKIDSAGEEIQHPVSASSSSGKIFIGGVAWETTEETFNNHFAKYGKITDSVVMMDKQIQKPRGFGFVTFADPSVIDKVLEDEHVIDGRVVEVKRTVPREGIPSKGELKTKKIFVGGIPTSFTEDELKEHFSSYGTVIENQIMLDHRTGRSRGFAFITFESDETVEKIISEGRMHDLAGKEVEIKKAEPKKAGGDPGFNRKGSYGNSIGSSYGYGGGFHGYGGGYNSQSRYYGEREGAFYGRGYGYGVTNSYSAPGYGLGYDGLIYGSSGFGAGNSYGGTGGYRGAYGGYGGGHGYGSRYHPYGR